MALGFQEVLLHTSDSVLMIETVYGLRQRFI